MEEPPYLIYNSRELSFWEKLKRFIFRIPESRGVKVCENLDRFRIEEIFHKQNICFDTETKNWWRREVENENRRDG